MEPIETAEATARCVRDFTAAFMVDPATYVKGAELGFAGADFYFAGRGGVLGDTPGPVVTAAFVFFAGEAVEAAWERSAPVASRADAAAAFAEAGHTWARSHLAGDEVLEAAAVVARIGAKVVDTADVAAAPLFAGWRALAVPDDPAGAAHHQLNALRELRGALHGGAVRAMGITPREAVAMSDPHMAPIHGWSDDFAVDESRRSRLVQAEAMTNAAMAGAFAVLDAEQAKAFAAACAVLHGQS